MLQIIVVLGVSGGIPASRVVRGAVLGVKENAYLDRTFMRNTLNIPPPWPLMMALFWAAVCR